MAMLHNQRVTIETSDENWNDDPTLEDPTLQVLRLQAKLL